MHHLIPFLNLQPFLASKAITPIAIETYVESIENHIGDEFAAGQY